jgi:uncharacterized membrane protein YuzA (DUF378 family)
LVEPGLQNILEPLNISALAYDNYQVLGLWLEIKDPDGFIIENYSLDYLDDNERYYRNNTYISSGVYIFTIWASDTSDNWASTTGSFEIEPEEGPDEYNWKPLIAILFAIILLIVGIIIVMIKPMKFTGELGRDRTYSFFAGVLPFVIAELITGLVSFFTGHLAVPPIFGVGMMVDLAILIVGLVACIVIYVKGEPYQSYEKKAAQPPSDEQVPPKTFQLDETKAPLSSPESPEPIAPPETRPPSPVPQPEEPPPPTPEPDEESPPTPPSPFE